MNDPLAFELNPLSGLLSARIVGYLAEGGVTQVIHLCRATTKELTSCGTLHIKEKPLFYVDGTLGETPT